MKAQYISLGLILLFSACTAIHSEEKAQGLTFTFNKKRDLKNFPGGSGRLTPGPEGTLFLCIENIDPEKGANRTASLPLELFSENYVTLRAELKAENISKPPKSWNGIKVMLILQTENGKQYPQIPLPAGTFEISSFEKVIRVPSGITQATLLIGLEKVSGTVWFKSIEIIPGKPKREGRRNKEMFRIQGMPRLRGVMIGPHFNKKDIEDLAGWGANQVRWQLNWNPMKEAEKWAQDSDRFREWLESALKEADKALPEFEKYGIHVLLDLHTPPGGRREHGICRLFEKEEYQDLFLESWKKIAKRYKGNKVIYAYDLMNEPVEGPGPLKATWRVTAQQAIQVIREIDPGKPVVVEPGPWGGPGGFDTFTPIDEPGIIYSFHMYIPHEFTHQGVRDSKVGFVYPGNIKNVMWNREALREAMRPAVEFQKEFNVPIHVGEFSAIRWAPDNSAYRYLKDLTDLFEEYGWDWTYHAYREYNGWSVEHGPDPKDTSPSKTQTDREKLLRSWFEKNKKESADSTD